MSSSTPAFLNRSFTFIGALGAILIFAAILYVAYLPNRAERVDAAVIAERQAKADEARASSIAKLNGFALVNKEAGTVRIPIELAKELTLHNYTVDESATAVAPAEAANLELE
ncbi:MAG: Uncharacterised protein [Opitutia bacterium UBA7350]|nr:MAG: Uncharacterised protein [Opitutae bacterium UBA7350]